MPKTYLSENLQAPRARGGKLKRSLAGAVVASPITSSRPAEKGISDAPPIHTVGIFLKKIKPFAEELAATWPGIPTRLRRQFLRELNDALGRWFEVAHLEFSKKMSNEHRRIVTEVLQDVAAKAGELHRSLEAIWRPFFGIPTPPIRPIFENPTHMNAYWVAAGNLHDAGEATTPSWNLESILIALSSMVAAAKKPTVKIRMTDGSFILQTLDAPAPMQRNSRKSRRGRPAGFRHHQNLDFLILELGVVAARAGVNLSAYMKDGGGVKVAAGSLIVMLEMLRAWFWDNIGWNSGIPFPNQHESHIATYQRILRRARTRATLREISGQSRTYREAHQKRR
jgi:hypothetical protein